MEESNSSDKLSKEQFMEIWKDVEWPVRYGSVMMMASGIITGNMFNHHYRKLCGMGKAFRMTTFLPVAVFFPVVGGFMHAAGVNKFISRKNKLKCPVCYELKSGLVQLFSGGIYPLLTGFVVCTGITRKYKKRNLHDIGLLGTVSRLSQFKMILPKGLALALLPFNFLIGILVAQLEYGSLLHQMKAEKI